MGTIAGVPAGRAAVSASLLLGGLSLLTLSSSAFAQGTAGAAPPSGAATSTSVTSTVTTSPTGISAGATATSATTGEDAEAAKEWAERDRQLGESNSLSGGVGLLRTLHAQSGAPGQFRLAFITEYFSAGFLCTGDYPCRNSRTGALETGDTLNHIGGTLNLGVTLFRLAGGSVEAYASTSAVANSSNVNRPSLLQVLGDTTFGAKAGFPLASGFHLGGFGELLLVNGTGSVGLAGAGTSGRLGPIVTFDLRELDAVVPLRLSANVAYFFDNRGEVVKATEASRGTPITRIERFGLNINRVDHLDVHFGAELLVAGERVRPFLEYGIAAPLNRQDYICRPDNPSQDDCLKLTPMAPSRLTFGGRFFPWKSGFGLTAALDVGVTGTRTFLEEVTPVPPWTLFLGAGWAMDTQERPAQVRTKVVDRIVEGKSTRGKLRGFVHERVAGAAPPAPPPTSPPQDPGPGPAAATPSGPPIANAIVVWENHPELTSLATGEGGRFVTQELPDGVYKFLVRADGFRDGNCEGTVDPAAPDLVVDCGLEALPRVGVVVGRVRDADSQEPVAGAAVKIRDSAGKEMSYVTDNLGGYRFDGIAPGKVSLMVDADNYMVAVQDAEARPRQDNTVDVGIRKRPKTSLVTVNKNEIAIKQQVQFATDSAVILPESFALLTEVADVLIKTSRIRKIEVQGHTDNSGTADHNQTLSDQRAEAVRTWLTSHGVGEGRLVSKGFGQTKPLVPNVTVGNRARNRRVQFVILDQDPAR